MRFATIYLNGNLSFAGSMNIKPKTNGEKANVKQSAISKCRIVPLVRILRATLLHAMPR